MNPPSTLQPDALGQDLPGPRFPRVAAGWHAMTFIFRKAWLRLWFQLAGLPTKPLSELRPHDRLAGLMLCAQTVFYREQVLHTREPAKLAEIARTREDFASGDAARWRPYIRFHEEGPQ